MNQEKNDIEYLNGRHPIWESKKSILIILAHPDDPEFFCGATIARWADEGHIIQYLLYTKGDKGSNNPQTSPEEISEERQIEQQKAAEFLGVLKVTFLNFEDGFLTSNPSTRALTTQAIRQIRPDILVSSDPTTVFPRSNRINHPDHRSAGQIVIDALFPASGNPHFFPEQLKNGLEPHTPDELWLSLTHEPNIILNVTDYWEKKIGALLFHKSQIGDREEFIQRMRGRHTTSSTTEKLEYEEAFRRLKLNQGKKR